MKSNKKLMEIITADRKVILGKTSNNKTDEYNVCVITEPNNKQYWYLNCLADDGTKTVVKITENKQLKSPKSSSWENLPTNIKKTHCYTLLGYRVSENTRNLFIYGLEKGLEMNEELDWINANLIEGNRILTKKVLELIGRWETVEKNGHYKNMAEYVFDNTHVIRIDLKAKTINQFESYYELKRRKGQFALLVKALARDAKVSFEVAKFAAKIKIYDEAVDALKFLVEAKQHITPIQKIELNKGFKNREKVFKEILGEKLFESLDIKTQTKSIKLANFLLYEQKKKIN